MKHISKSKYKTITIKTFENETRTCNCESHGYRRGGYLNYYNCAICKNQSVGDDDPFYCNNNDILQDVNDEKQYCANYERNFEYIERLQREGDVKFLRIE